MSKKINSDSLLQVLRDAGQTLLDSSQVSTASNTNSDEERDIESNAINRNEINR